MSSSTKFGSGIFNSGGLGSAPFFNTSSIIDAVLYSTGHSSPLTETTKRASILQFVNNTYQEMNIGYHWKWRIAGYDFNLYAPYITGTVAATQGDQTITGTNTIWSAAIEAKSMFFLDGSKQTYRVSTITSNTELELETKFSEDTATEQGYTIVQNQYEMPKETDNIISCVLDGVNQLRPTGLQDFRRLQAADPTRKDAPKYFTFARRETDDDAVYIEFYPAPDKRYNLHIDYQVRILQLEDDTTNYPIVPDRYRVVLFYGALSQYLVFFANDPDKAAQARRMYETTLLKMINDKEITDQHPVIDSRHNYKKRRLGKRGYTYTIEQFGKLD